MLENTTPRLSLAHLKYLVLALVLIFTSPAYAQEDCGCDHVISPTTGYVKASSMPTVQPGDVICIQAGVRSRLKFIGFEGTKEKPLIFKNCGGQVIFDRTVDNTTASGSLLFENSRYFRVTGTGSPDYKYGFLIRKTNGSAVSATETDFEIDHIEIADAGFAGIFAKIEAYCDNTEYHRGNFVMDNISIHDNYIHDTHGEGMYIGSSWYEGKQNDCGMLYPPLLHNLKVYNNIIENTGADGLQIGCAGKDAEVYNNIIRNYGFNPFAAVHTNGLMLGGGFQGKVYNNQIFDGAGMGLNCFGRGNVWMYNNLVVRAGTDGIFIDERGPLIPGTGFHAHNNTVIAPKRDGIRVYTRNSVGNTFINNIVVAPGSLGTNYYNKDHYLFIISDEVDYSQKNNLHLATADLAHFINAAADNYELKSSSPAIDKGALMSYITFDFNNAARPQGAGFDIGAYEFGGETTPINNAPIVSAGEDKTLNLPANNTILTATATDADGSIASVKWTKVSGPAATLSGTTTLTLGLSSLLEGEYLFRFTATDNLGATSMDDVLVSVVGAPVENIAPSVNAGTDQVLTLPENSITLTGSANDPDGSIVKNEWIKLSGPAATLSGASTLTLGLNGLVEGTYLFRLTATDNTGASTTDDVQVTVHAAPVTNLLPSVLAGTDQILTLPSNSTSLAGTATDADGTIASVKWTKISGPAATLSGVSTLTPSLSGLIEGTYLFRLTATDNLGATASDDVQVIVKASPVANQAPEVAAGPDKSLTLPTNSLTLSASAKDADGIIASAIWTKVNGPAATMDGTSSLNLALSDLVEGTYTFRLTVKDNAGASAYDDVNLTVYPAAITPPVAENNGLNFAYYTAIKKNTWTKLPDFSIMTPVKTGIAPTISLDAKTQTDFFGFVFTGFLEIKETGNYTFYTLSDEGSQLYINQTLIAENKGANNVQERSGTVHLAAGFHPIKVNYFDRTSAEKLEVSYVGPGFKRMQIPSAVLYPNLPANDLLAISEETTEETLKSSDIAAPTDLTVRYNSDNETAYLSWNDNSTSETSFEIFMATGSSEAEYKKAGSTAKNKKNYTVVRLSKNETYHIKVRARTLLTFSDYTNTVAVNSNETQKSDVIRGQKVLVNFNYGQNAAAPWNNFDQDPDPMDMMTNLKDDKGASTSISVKLLSSWGWANTGGNGWNNLGMTTGDNSGVIPDDVMKTCFWTERTEAEEVEIAGLQPNQFYRFTFYGSRDAEGDRTTHYRIGKKTVTLDASYNTKKKVSIYNAKADANGKLKVWVQKGKKAIFGYLNAMTIEATGYVAPGMEETESLKGATAQGNGQDMMNKTAGAESDFQTFSAYPNPATDHIILHYKNTTPHSTIELQVIDLTGNVRISTQETATDVNGTIRIELDPSRIASGYYLLKIRSESGDKTLKFLKM